MTGMAIRLDPHHQPVLGTHLLHQVRGCFCWDSRTKMTPRSLSGPLGLQDSRAKRGGHAPCPLQLRGHGPRPWSTQEREK